jgi:hypothetical protein
MRNFKVHNIHKLESLRDDFFSKAIQIEYAGEDFYRDGNIVVVSIKTIFEDIKRLAGNTLIEVAPENVGFFINQYLIPVKAIEYPNFTTFALHKDLLSMIAIDTSILPHNSLTQQNIECLHPRKYKNTLSANLSFMVCPDCKKEL